MGRSPCCDKVGLKKGPWTPEEDQKLLAYIEEHGHGSWRALPAKAGLQRCGKSCRLRWTNYLRPDIKRGKFSLQEEQTIIQLHALLGNRWSAIATHLAKRTDNEIKNYWNTHLKKRLTKMGIDPVTHKPRNDALLPSDGQSNKTAANLSHMAQWESARLEAEARLARESRLRSSNDKPPPIPSLHVFKGGDLIESPTSTLSFSDNNAPQVVVVGSSSAGGGVVKEEKQLEWKGYGDHEAATATTSGGFHHELTTMSMEATWGNGSHHHQSLSLRTCGGSDDGDANNNIVEEGFTSLLLNDDSMSLSEGGGESNNAHGFYEDNNNYWNTILNLVNSSPSPSPIF